LYIWSTLIAKKRRRQRHSQSKLGYAIFRHLEDDGTPLPLYENELPEDMSWSDLKGCDLSYMVAKGWKFDRLMKHFNVDRLALIKKLQFSWK